jgi:spatacsin
VVPLAIRSFANTSVVASCNFFFELCGISFDLLRLDINALRRISSHYGQAEKTLALNLAKELADEYIKFDYLEINNQNQKMPPSKTLVKILHYLEEASLPVIEEEDNCGSWLKSGTGDASQLRSKQSEASRYWSLVIDFCQVHRLPISTKYLALLASNNDWVCLFILYFNFKEYFLPAHCNCGA